MAIIHDDAITANAVAAGTGRLADLMGLETVFCSPYRKATIDFTAVLDDVAGAEPDVIVIASSHLAELTAFTRQLRRSRVKPQIVACYPYGLLPEFYRDLEADGEDVFSATFWDAGLARPGNADFVREYVAEYGRVPTVPSAVGYAGFSLLHAAIGTAGTLESEALRSAFLSLKTQTILGGFSLMSSGLQAGMEPATIQWQDGKAAIVLPDSLSSSQPRIGW
nr:ABC transporter substrate-binding protein [Paraburkholderia bannensis]